MNKKLVVSLGMLAAMLVGAPAEARDGETDRCWLNLASGLPDCIEMSTDSGRQADGTGVYLDDITLDCHGNLENRPAFDGYDLTVFKWLPRKSEYVVVYLHDNPDINQPGDSHFCDGRSFATSVPRLKGNSFVVLLDGKLRSNNSPDHDVLLQICIPSRVC